MKKIFALLLFFTLASVAKADISLDVKCTHIGPEQARISETQSVTFNRAILITKDGKQVVTLSAIPADRVKLGGTYTVTLATSGAGVPVAFRGGDDITPRQRPQARGVTQTVEVAELYAIKLSGTDKDSLWAVNISGITEEQVGLLNQKQKYVLRVE